MNYLIITKLKKIVELQDIIKNNDLNYKSKRGKAYSFGQYSLPVLMLIIAKVILLMN